jgi:hypothetical protein
MSLLFNEWYLLIYVRLSDISGMGMTREQFSPSVAQILRRFLGSISDGLLSNHVNFEVDRRRFVGVTKPFDGGCTRYLYSRRVMCSKSWLVDKFACCGYKSSTLPASGFMNSSFGLWTAGVQEGPLRRVVLKLQSGWPAGVQSGVSGGGRSQVNDSLMTLTDLPWFKMICRQAVEAIADDTRCGWRSVEQHLLWKSKVFLLFLLLLTIIFSNK